MKSTKLLTALFILFVAAQTFGFLYLHIFYTPAKALWENPTTNMQIPFPELKFHDAKPCPPPDDDKMCVPWIGDYITGLYKYAVGIVGILATVVMMIGGVMWITAVGNASRLSEAKAWIGAALTGLILAMTSYTILYQVNPKLTQFAGIPVAIPKPLEQEQNTGASTVGSLRALYTDYAGIFGDIGNITDLIVSTAEAAETTSGATDDLTAQFFKLEREFASELTKKQKLEEAAAAAEQAARQARSAQNAAFKALENEFLKQQKEIKEAKEKTEAALIAAEKAEIILAEEILNKNWDEKQIAEAAEAAKKAKRKTAYKLKKEARKITLASKEVQEPISFEGPQKIEVNYILVVQSKAIENAPIKTYSIAGGYVESKQEALDTLAKLKKDPATLKVFKIIEAACQFPSINFRRK